MTRSNLFLKTLNVGLIDYVDGEKDEKDGDHTEVTIYDRVLCVLFCFEIAHHKWNIL